MATINISGIAIPRLSFGVGSLMKWAPGHASPLPTDSSIEVQQAIDAGFRHFNTGDLYTNNESFAKVLRRSNLERSEVFLSFKLNTYASLGCRGRDHMIQNVKDEIERFGLEGYIDILQLHFPPRGYAGNMTNREAWRVLEDLKDQGLARIIGVSNWTLPDYHDIFNASDLKHPPQLNEYEFNPFLLFDPKIRQLHDFEVKHNIVPMNYGVLTVISGRLPTENSTALLQKLEEQSKQTKLPAADLLLSWAYYRPDAGIVVTSTSKADRARKTFELLSAEESPVNSQIYEEIEKAAELDGPDVASCAVFSSYLEIRRHNLHAFGPNGLRILLKELNYPAAIHHRVSIPRRILQHHQCFPTPTHASRKCLNLFRLYRIPTLCGGSQHVQEELMMSLFVLYSFLALLASGWLFRHIRSCLPAPEAYGPAFARWTGVWYIWKIWQGNYEVYDIEAHKNGSRKVVRIAPLMYSIDDPAMVRVIYGISSPFPKSKWYDAFGDPRIPNHNLFSARDRAMHGLMRRKVASMYSMSTIKSYESHVDSCVALLLSCFDGFAASGETFDLQLWMQCYAFDVIGKITFGRHVGFLESGGQDLDGIMRALEDGNAFSTISGVSVALLPILLILYGNPVRGITGFARRLQLESIEDDLTEKTGGETFLAKVKRLQKEAPEECERLRVETVALTGNVAAGSDTTSISLTSALYHAITTDGVVERLYEEVESQGLCSNPDQRITFDQAQQLPYLQMVIKEALRVHPAVGLPMWREVVGSGLEIDGNHFPPGAIIGINPWVAHRNVDVFGADAAGFRPERWDPQYTSTKTLEAMDQYYLPFGAGSRTCIGRHISHLEMVKLIPELIRRYEFESVGGELKTVNRWFVKPQKVLFRVKRRGTGA
ncbi:cytochrome P450 [Colletotrichum karsti]|uniref:Cytochrome P450 n=1 Tax=Colletotrichum karsti TaxID=1095194 RepID=A0A9P6I319_9PEZI|nr:cytochrome P450 [Colletotrichum karsti]KAF9871030.1 cytochrome P450 [Colletotrichum karsti]